MAQIQTVKFQNPDYGDIYTAQFQKNGNGWIGKHDEYMKRIQ